jgi:SAM-dependent methyltransferase
MARARPAKRYDRDYFERWYRRAASRLEPPAALRRRVAMVVAAAERWLERPIRDALDVGCGEARWRAELRRLRPRLRYVGTDPSAYVVGRYGRARGIVRGGFGDLPALELGGPFDLVICADVLHYVPDDELERGLPALARRVGGLAYLEVLTSADPVEGDRSGLRLRAPRRYAEAFGRLGLTGVGAHCWLGADLADAPAALERSDVAALRPRTSRPGRAAGHGRS